MATRWWVVQWVGLVSLGVACAALWWDNAALAVAVGGLDSRIPLHAVAPVAAAEPDLQRELVRLDQTIDTLLGRLERLEAPSRSEGVAPHLAETAPVSEDPAARAASEGPRAPVTAPEIEEFAALMSRLQRSDFSIDGSPEEQARFWELARTSGVLPALIDQLLARIEANPADVAARLDLADAYIAKLLTVPIGPERGVFGDLAERQWSRVLELEPRNWQAQSAIANSLSHYPAFLHRTDDAIRELEKTRELQRALSPDPAQEETYLRLSLMYQRKNQGDKARETLQEGLRRHPDSAPLQRALEELDP